MAARERSRGRGGAPGAAGRAEGARPIGNVRCGITAWTERTLVRESDFYPPEVRSAADRLRYYATQFPVVEVDSTYYAPPSERNARLWAERTPPDFVFDVKAFGLLTHHPAAIDRLPEEILAELPDEELEKKQIYLRAVSRKARERLFEMHVEALRPLADAGKLGAVLFQFPHWFRASRPGREYLREVRDRLPWRIAVEFRGAGWMETPDDRKRTLQLLEELGFSYVVVDEPQGFHSSTPPVVAATAPLAVVRFHGRNNEMWERTTRSAAQRFRYLYSRDELRRWVPAIRELSSRSDEVHALMNNCYRDYATRNANDLAALLTGRDRR